MKNDFWMRDRIRGVHVDFHMPEFPKEAIKNFNAKEFVGELKRAKVNMAAIFCKCHFGNAFYNTQVGHKHSGLKEDFFGEVLEESHKHDIKVLAYYSLGTDEYAVKQNPDWYQVDEEGKIRDGNGTVWHRPCMNSPYREELVLPQIKEITSNYDIDGMFIDIPYIQHHICFCRYCKKKFKDEYGIELNRELYDTNKEMIVEFGKNSAIRCLKEIYRTVKEIKPDVPVGVNCAYKMGEPKELQDINEYGVWESQPAAGSYLYHSVKSRWARHQNAPVQVQTVRFTEGWGLMSCKTPEQLKYEAATIIANGGVLNIGDQVMPDGTLQKGAYDVLEEVFTFVEEREQFATRSQTIPHIALIANYTSNRYWDNGDFSTLGASKMLIEGHQQFDIFYNDEFPDLSSYAAVVLPETVRLNEQSIERIKEYVRLGGLLLAEATTTLPKGSKNYGLADVFGLDFLEYAPYRFAYMGINEDLWKNTAEIPQLVDAAFIKAVPTTAEVLSKIQWPCGESVPPRAFRHPLPPPGDMSDFPAISLNRFGEGKAIYFASPIFKTYWEQNHFWVKNIFNNCINTYVKNRPYIIEGYSGVEATLTEKDNKNYLHLVNFQNGHSGNRSTAFYDPIEHITPIHNLVIKIKNNRYSQVVLQPEGKHLNFTTVGDYIQVTIPEMHIYSILELR